MTACIANIGPRERRKRLVFGAAASVLSILFTLILVTTGTPRIWRVLLFLPLWLAALGVFQAREKT